MQVGVWPYRHLGNVAQKKSYHMNLTVINAKRSSPFNSWFKGQANQIRDLWGLWPNCSSGRGERPVPVHLLQVHGDGLLRLWAQGIGNSKPSNGSAVGPGSGSWANSGQCFLGAGTFTFFWILTTFTVDDKIFTSLFSRDLPDRSKLSQKKMP